MARGDTMVSPWTWQSHDYVGLAIKITVNFNDATRALTSSVVHRDDGCQYNTIVFDVPSSANAKRLPAPTDGQGDKTYTANQMKQQGLSVIEDVLAIQITAEP